MKEPRVWNYHALVRRQLRGRLLGWLAVGAFAILALVIIRILSPPDSVRLKIASGETEGAVHQFLLSLAGIPFTVVWISSP